MEVEAVIETLGYALAQSRTNITIDIIGALAMNLGAKQDKFTITEFVDRVRRSAEARGWVNPDGKE
jgi:hypothetical protein